jgi:hypothetical protein
MSKRRSLWLLVLPLLVFLELPVNGLSQEVSLETASVEGGDSPSKFENGFQIFWRNTEVAGDPNSDAADPEAKIKIFEGAASELAVSRVADVLRAADPNFSGVSIYDVSARKPGFIAVAAVYSRAKGNNVAVLLYFDWNGSLLQRTVLSKRPEIQSLEITPAGHVWVLNDFHAGDPNRFVFTQFDANGAAIKEAVRARPNWSTDESQFAGGQTSFGVIGNRIWAWLAKPQTFLSFDDDTGRTEIEQTGFPHLEDASGVYARQAVLLRDGQLLMDVGWIKAGQHDAAWFTWSAYSGWEQVHRAPDYLYAVEGNKVIFSAFTDTASNKATFRSEAISSLLASASPR